MITQAERDKLHQFFAGYFHEDWSLDANSADEVVSQFVEQRRASSELQELGRSVVEYVREHSDDGRLEEALFNDLGCYYSPRADGIAARTWLLNLAAKLQEAGKF